jgi:Rha family phage regulatory protein
MSILVRFASGEKLVSSLDVAKAIGSKHCYVLHCIRKLIDDPAVKKAFSKKNFIKSSYKDDRGRDYPVYMLTRDGFSLLVMSMTGPIALKHKFELANMLSSMGGTP